MLNIQHVSQKIGIAPDTLRVWERRYGFPIPKRDRRGHRIYSSDQVDALRVVKKLQDLGQRPGVILALTSGQRQDLLHSLVEELTPGSEHLRRLACETPAIEIAPQLNLALKTQGLQGFVLETAVPLLKIIGLGWVDGSISIAREHIISDLLEEMITRQMRSHRPQPQSPRILFLTLSGERHRLGLLLAAALFQNQGVESLLINEDIPPNEVPQLVEDLQVDAVAVSFSQQILPLQAKKELVALRSLLPRPVKLIAGGQGLSTGSHLPGICICTDLQQIPTLCEREFGSKQRST